MAVEDFTTYTKVDPNSDITITSSKVAFDTLLRSAIAYVTSDKGVNFFDGDFEHWVEIYANPVEDFALAWDWLLANVLSGELAMNQNDDEHFAVGFYSDAGNLLLRLAEGGLNYYQDTYNASLSTIYYLKIVRDESVGTYGTIYCYIYSNVERTNLLGTLSLALHIAKFDFRYIYALCGYGGGTQAITGYTENLNLTPTPAAIPRFQAAIF